MFHPTTVVDLLAALQIHSTALAALAGDPAYTRDEVRRLAELLAVAIGGEQSQALIRPLLDSEPDWLAGLRPDWLNDYWQVPLDPAAQAYARKRVAGLASPLRATLCADALEQLKNLSPEAHDGLQRLINATDESKVAQIFNDYDETLRTAFFSTFNNIEINQLKGLVSKVNGDLVKLEDFLGRMGDATKLENLLNKATVAQVEEMITLTDASSTLERVVKLAEDPAQNLKITNDTIFEAKIGLELEKRGALTGLRSPIERDPTGNAEFIDSNGLLWDKKGYNSKFPPSKGGYELETTLEDIEKELFVSGENVIIDTTKMNDDHIAELKRNIQDRGWSSRIRWYP